MDEIGVVVWYLVFCFFLVWFIVGVVLFKGIKFFGKVSWKIF